MTEITQEEYEVQEEWLVDFKIKLKIEAAAAAVLRDYDMLEEADELLRRASQ